MTCEQRRVHPAVWCLWFVAIIGAASAAGSVYGDHPGAAWLVMASLALMTAAHGISLYSGPARR